MKHSKIHTFSLKYSVVRTMSHPPCKNMCTTMYYFFWHTFFSKELDVVLHTVYYSSILDERTFLKTCYLEQGRHMFATFALQLEFQGGLIFCVNYIQCGVNKNPN